MIVTYFKRCTEGHYSVVDALKSVGVKNPSLEYRKKIAKLNGISGVGTIAGNTKMLELLKKGKLIKSKTLEPGEKFVKYLNEIHGFIKEHGDKFFYSYTNAESTFAKAQKVVKAGKRTGITCVVPTRWGMKLMGINPSGFYGRAGKFSKFTDSMKKQLTKITVGNVIGKTIKQAVDNDLLKPGDIIVFKDRTHTVSYTGKGYYVFDGGHAAIKNGKYKGIVLDYSVIDKNYKISGILRWK